MDDADLQKTSRFARLKTVQAGNTILTERKRADTIFILISGKLLVSQGGHTLLKITEPGSFVGETYALLDQPSAVTVEAEVDSVVLPIPMSKLNVFFQQVPDQAQRLARILGKRLMDAYGEIQRQKKELEQAARGNILRPTRSSARGDLGTTERPP